MIPAGVDVHRLDADHVEYSVLVLEEDGKTVRRYTSIRKIDDCEEIRPSSSVDLDFASDLEDLRENHGV